MASPVYQLYYFAGIRGRVEPVRCLLEDQGIPYEFTGRTFPEWADAKTAGLADGSIPLGQMPVINDGNISVGQTSAIMRFLARRHGLYGATPEASAAADMISDACADAMTQYVAIAFDPEGAPRINKWLTQDIATWFTSIQNFIQRRGGPYVAGDAITYADYTLFFHLDFMTRLVPTALDPYPGLLSFFKTMARRPGMAAWITSPRREAHMLVPRSCLDNPAAPVSAEGAGFAAAMATSAT